MDSLLAQTYENLEILVIDDCSTDKSVEILRRYEGHPKVRLVVRETNGGWVVVSNQGVDMSRGEFVIFANCDDDCKPRMIERLVTGMAGHSTAGISFCRSLLIDENDKVLTDDFTVREAAFRERCASDTLIEGREMVHFLLYSCVIPNLSAALFRRSAFSRVGMLSSDYRVCCDWDLFFRIVKQYDVFYVAEPLNLFRQHETTIRSSTKERIIYEEIFRLLLGELRAQRMTTTARMRFRTRIMFFWAEHIIGRSTAGLKNIKYHLGRIVEYDATALLFLIPGLLLRSGDIAAKVVRGRR
jgi:glycosyltransferase involved in cell wall biosynthesis